MRRLSLVGKSKPAQTDLDAPVSYSAEISSASYRSEMTDEAYAAVSGSEPKGDAFVALDDKSSIKLFARTGDDKGADLLTWRYEDLSVVAWDHQHSSVKMSNKTVESGAPSTYSVTVESTGPLGLNLKTSHAAGYGKSKSAAVENVSGATLVASRGSIKPGHLIISVNGENTADKDFDATLSTLKDASRPITIEFANVDALSEDLGGYFILKVARSAELEKQMTARISALFNPSETERAEGTAMQPNGPPPQFTYIGIFAGAEKPKPFQRKRASLTSSTNERLPSASTMRRLSMTSTQERKKGSREEFALQHIHEGRNVFKVMLAGGVRKDLIMENSQLQVVLSAASTDRNKLDIIIPYDQVDQYELQGEKIAIATKAAEGEEAATHFFNTSDPSHMLNTFEFFLNQYRAMNGQEYIPGSTHGRTVQMVQTLTGTVDAKDSVSAELKEQMQLKATMDVIPAADQAKLAKSRRGSIGGQKPMWWNQLVVSTGWMHKKGGMTKSWQRRFFILYNTSQGHLLAYYAGYEETPLHCASYKERNMLDCCMITQIRPASIYSDVMDNAFDVVTIDREWTFCAESEEDRQIWLQLLSRAVDEDVAITPDDVLDFSVKAVLDPSKKLNADGYTTTLKVQSQGIQIWSGDKEEFFWCYTDIFRWSVAQHHNKPCVLLTVFTTEDFSEKQDFVFRTKKHAESEVVKLTSAIDFYIEKFMTVMQLKCPAVEEDQSAPPMRMPEKADPADMPELPDMPADEEDEEEEEAAAEEGVAPTAEADEQD